MVVVVSADVVHRTHHLQRWAVEVAEDSAVLEVLNIPVGFLAELQGQVLPAELLEVGGHHGGLVPALEVSFVAVLLDSLGGPVAGELSVKVPSVRVLSLKRYNLQLLDFGDLEGTVVFLVPVAPLGQDADVLYHEGKIGALSKLEFRGASSLVPGNSVSADPTANKLRGDATYSNLSDSSRVFAKSMCAPSISSGLI